MIGNLAINVVLSLIFIYLLYSLLATIINEIIANFLDLRAKKLEKAIIRMLTDEKKEHKNIWSYIWMFFSSLWEKIISFLRFIFWKKADEEGQTNMAKSFYNHPGIKYLGKNQVFSKPSYISTNFFSKALVDILKEADTKSKIQPNTTNNSNLNQILRGLEHYKNDHEETVKFIKSLLEDANNDIEKFKTNLENWFDETMKRTTSWYTKQARTITFAIGLILAITFNVDTISIVNKLSKDPEASKAMAEMSIRYIEANKDSLGHYSKKIDSLADTSLQLALQQIKSDIKDANSVIGLGWYFPPDTISMKDPKKFKISSKDSAKCWECLKKSIIENNCKTKKVNYVLCMATRAKRLLGFLITALALSLGAPFWFDLLNKCIQLRGSVQTSVSKNDSTPKKSDSGNISNQAVG